VRITYFASGNYAWASSRLRAHKIVYALEKLGHAVTYDEVTPLTEVVVVQKRVDLWQQMRAWRQDGVRVIFDMDDYIPTPAADYADCITVDTPAKLALYPSALVVPDCLDTDPDSPIKTGHRETLERVVWVGNRDNLYHIANAAEACRRLGLTLTVITDLTSGNIGSEYGVYGIQWDIANVDAAIVETDVAICPFLPDAGQWSREWVLSKSANKLLKMWALGLPCAGSPIPSYVEAGLEYCATTVDEWVAVLTLLHDARLRERDAIVGYERAQAYRADVVVHRWLRVFAG
jgi:hypothetical protein